MEKITRALQGFGGDQHTGFSLPAFGYVGQNGQAVRKVAGLIIFGHRRYQGIDDLAVLEVRHAAIGGHIEEHAAGEEGRHLGRVAEDRPVVAEVLVGLPGARSAGRVQSVCLRLIVEREQEIEAFNPREYWSVKAVIETPRGKSFEARLVSLAGKHSVVVVEHDMEFIRSIARKVTVLHQGSVLAEGSMDDVQNDQRVIDVYLGR